MGGVVETDFSDLQFGLPYWNKSILQKKLEEAGINNGCFYYSKAVSISFLVG